MERKRQAFITSNFNLIETIQERRESAIPIIKYNGFFNLEEASQLVGNPNTQCIHIWSLPDDFRMHGSEFDLASVFEENFGTGVLADTGAPADTGDAPVAEDNVEPDKGDEVQDSQTGSDAASAGAYSGQSFVDPGEVEAAVLSLRGMNIHSYLLTLQELTPDSDNDEVEEFYDEDEDKENKPVPQSNE